MAFQTQRILLRTPVSADDAPTFWFYTHPPTMRHLPTLLRQPWTMARIAARRKALAREELQGRARTFTVVLRNRGQELGEELEDEGEVIGLAGLSMIWAGEMGKRGEVGVILAHACQGRGLVWDVHLGVLTVGFEELGLEVVEWVTGEGNEGMRAVLGKMGCVDAGGFVEDGESWVRYTLGRSEWGECKVRLRERVDRLAGS